jgi:hypothetical protein
VAKPIDWEALLVKGYEPMKLAKRIFRPLPHDPRCKLCLSPFGGVGGKMIGLLGHRPSRKSPNICQFCFDRLPTGGIEIDIGVVFADVRASTALGERSDATTFAERLNAFYATATKVLIHNEGIVDKLIAMKSWVCSSRASLVPIIDARQRLPLSNSPRSSPNYLSVSLPTRVSPLSAMWDRGAYWTSLRWVTPSTSAHAFRPTLRQERSCSQLRFTH